MPGAGPRPWGDAAAASTVARALQRKSRRTWPRRMPRRRRGLRPRRTRRWPRRTRRWPRRTRRVDRSRMKKFNFFIIGIYILGFLK